MIEPLSRPPIADRILVIRLGALGDVIRTFPAVAALREHYRAAHLAWLVEAGSAEAVATQRSVDEIVLFPRRELERALRAPRPVESIRLLRAFLRDLRRRRFDLVLDFHGILKSGLLCLLSGAPLRVGYAPPFAREFAWLGANRRARLPARRLSRFARNQALVEYLGASPPVSLTPLIRPGEEVIARMRSALPAPVLAPVALHPGSSAGAAYKRYTVEGYAEVARQLADDPGVPSIVIAGRGEEDLAQAIVDASGGSACRAPGTETFEELAALLVCCRLFVSGDSGPLHAASLVGTPVVQLSGPTNPIENEPWAGTPWRRVRVPMSCSPCRRGCASATCMRSIPPESVADAARELLVQIAGAATGTRAGSPAETASSNHASQRI